MAKRSICVDRLDGSGSSSSSVSRSKRRAVSTNTVDKWILEHDKALNTATTKRLIDATLQDSCVLFANDLFTRS